MHGACDSTSDGHLQLDSAAKGTSTALEAAKPYLPNDTVTTRESGTDTKAVVTAFNSDEGVIAHVIVTRQHDTWLTFGFVTCAYRHVRLGSALIHR